MYGKDKGSRKPGKLGEFYFAKFVSTLADARMAVHVHLQLTV